jgi:hypothetical protein
LLAMEGDLSGATRLLGAAQAIMQAGHIGWWPADRVELERTDNLIRKTLSDEAFNAAWSAGQQLTVEDLLGELIEST